MPVGPVPVGGSTPDRLRSDRLGPVRDGGEEMRIDEKVCLGGCLFGFGIAGGGFGGGGSFRSGVQPPTGSGVIGSDRFGTGERK